MLAGTKGRVLGGEVDYEGMECYIILLGAPTKMSPRAGGEVCPNSAREVLAGLKIFSNFAAYFL